MKNVIVELNESTNTIHLPDGSQYCLAVGTVLNEAPKNDVLSLVKAGLTADDLINLKKAELLWKH